MDEYRYTISQGIYVVASNVPRMYLSTLVNALLDDCHLDCDFAITIRKYRYDGADKDVQCTTAEEG